MSDRFNDRTIIITGALGALGEVLVRGFAREGGRVAVAAREHHRKAGEKLAAQVGNGAIFVSLDVADEASWADAMRAVQERLGPASVLIGNAAYAAKGGIEDVPIAEWHKSIETNLTGTLLGIRAVAPSMRERGGGSIVIVSSVAALHAAPGLASYGASKWGIRGLIRTAAQELARDKIRVNAVHPGIIETPLAYDPETGKQWAPTDKQAIPRNASPEEIVKYILFMASEDAAYATASEFVADGGYSLGPIER